MGCKCCKSSSEESADENQDIFRGRNRDFKEGKVYICGRLVQGTLETHHYILVKLPTNDENYNENNSTIDNSERNNDSDFAQINKKSGLIFEWTQEKNKFNSYYHFGYAKGDHHICEELGTYSIM